MTINGHENLHHDRDVDLIRAAVSLEKKGLIQISCLLWY